MGDIAGRVEEQCLLPIGQRRDTKCCRDRIKRIVHLVSSRLRRVEKLQASVAALFRYPVKSMLGEQLQRVSVSERGFVGDRVAALAEGDLLASAKLPAKWARLLQARGTYSDGVVTVTLPDGSDVRGDDARIDAAVSAFVGRAVRWTTTRPMQPVIERLPGWDPTARSVIQGTIAAAAPEGFFDFAPVHLITTSTLAALDAEAAPFRPNILVATDGGGFVENDWVGHEVRIGTDLVMRVDYATPRCVVPSVAHGDLPASPAAIRTAARLNRLAVAGNAQAPCAGVYATVVAGGTIAVGDAVEVL